MKPKMRFNTANGYALLHMIGQSEDMGIECNTAIVANYAGLSKTAILPRMWDLLDSGYVECHVDDHRPNAVKFVFALTKCGRDMYNEKRFQRSYRSWVAMSDYVRGIRIGSTKAMLV